jgi:hypothetical protein
MKIYLVRAELFHADRRTDITKVRVVFATFEPPVRPVIIGAIR